ncbi:MAG: iron-containing alcohol dehydrogenase [Candidatus Diapherotrites archaeon]
MNNWNFFNPVDVAFGEGRFAEFADFASKFENKRILLVTGKSSMTKLGFTGKIKKFFSGNEIEVFNKVEPNPSLKTIDESAQFARLFHPDLIIGLGGGSAIDAAKFCAALNTNPGDAKDYFYDKKEFSKPATTLVAITTTSGTGSEVTPYGVYTDHEKNLKQGFSTPVFFAQKAIVDPSLTVSMSKDLTSSTGLDAFSHGIESLWSPKASKFSQLFSVEAIKLVYENLINTIHKPLNIELRTSMSHGQLLAGYSISLAGTNAMHAFSYPLTVKYNVPHGTACAITTVGFMNAVKKEKNKELQMITCAIGADNIDDAISKIEQFFHAAGVKKLSDYGVSEEDLDDLLDGTNVPKVKASFPNFNEVKIREVFENSL